MHGPGDRRPARGPGRRGRGRSAGGCPGPRCGRHVRRRRLRGRAAEGGRRRVEPGRRDAAAVGRSRSARRRAGVLLTAVRAVGARRLSRAGGAASRIDLRDEFRHAVVDEFVAAHAAGRTPNPCMRCNGAFRFAAIAEVRGSDRGGADRDRPLRPRSSAAAERRWSRAAPTRPRTSPTCSRRCRPRSSSGAGSRSVSRRRSRPVRRRRRRAWPRQAPPRARRCASSAAAITGRSWSAMAVPAAPGRSSTATGRVLGTTAGCTGSRPASAGASAWAAAMPPYVLRTEPASGRVVVGPRGSWRGRRCG